ncbi:MAG: hypothetical protein ACJ76Z_05910 [Thermoleophilaceae bacterium]
MLISDTGATRDVSARLQEATRELASLYERNAYLAYNVALRITCEREAAMAAAERAFLADVTGADAEEQLLPRVVGFALEGARPRPRPRGAGADEEEQLLALTASELDAHERALLVLTSLVGMDPPEGAALLGADDGEARLEEAWAKLAAARGETQDEATAGYERWLWAAPPTALWDGIYQKFYRAAERALAEPDGDLAATQKLPAQPRPKRARRSLSGAKFALALLIPAALTAGAFALPQMRHHARHHKPTTLAGAGALAPAPPPATGDDLAPAPAPPASPTATSGGHKKKKPLTARQLDQLRQNELRALELYSKREEDRRLTKAQRDYAAQKVALLRDLAERRIAAAKRERELARAQRRTARKEAQLERERRQAAQQKHTLKVQETDGSSSPPSGPPQKQSSGEAPTDSSQAQQQCLYDADNGTYICQQ